MAPGSGSSSTRSLAGGQRREAVRSGQAKVAMKLWRRFRQTAHLPSPCRLSSEVRELKLLVRTRVRRRCLAESKKLPAVGALRGASFEAEEDVLCTGRTHP